MLNGELIRMAGDIGHRKPDTRRTTFQTCTPRLEDRLLRCPAPEEGFQSCTFSQSGANGGGLFVPGHHLQHWLPTDGTYEFQIHTDRAGAGQGKRIPSFAVRKADLNILEIWQARFAQLIMDNLHTVRCASEQLRKQVAPLRQTGREQVLFVW